MTIDRAFALILGVLLATPVRLVAAPPACVVVTPEITGFGPICLDNDLYDTIALAVDPDADLRRARWSCELATGEVLLDVVHRLPAGEVLARVPPPEACVLLEPFLGDIALPGACLLALEIEDRAGETGRCLAGSVTYDRMIQE